MPLSQNPADRRQPIHSALFIHDKSKKAAAEFTSSLRKLAVLPMTRQCKACLLQVRKTA
jgi:hypothetical protein